eukprot:m.18837 g.18837  ORF g.18837 m.18837 type:complete len:233 (-) comp10859_c0_seq1:461-1159(-)
MHICARNSHSTGQSSSPALVAPWCVQHACNSKQSNSLSDSLCLLGHALRTIIRSKVHHCLKALSSLATVAVDSSKRAAKEHVSVAGQVLAACEAIEQCPKTMAAAAADRLTSQLSQLEDVSGEFAEAIAESQRLLSSEDVEAAIEKAMTQGLVAVLHCTACFWELTPCMQAFPSGMRMKKPCSRPLQPYSKWLSRWWGKPDSTLPTVVQASSNSMNHECLSWLPALLKAVTT